jgi:hypothetical protein
MGGRGLGFPTLSQRTRKDGARCVAPGDVDAAITLETGATLL